MTREKWREATAEEREAWIRNGTPPDARYRLVSGVGLVIEVLDGTTYTKAPLPGRFHE